MGLTVRSSSPSPVSVAAMKSHCRISGVWDDDVLPGFIEAATGFIEQATNTTLRPTDYRLVLDGFPVGREIKLPRPPAIEVESVAYTDADGSGLLLDASDYAADIASRPGRIVLRNGLAWPQTSNDAACVVIDYRAGHEGELPPLLRQGVLLLAAYFYEHREAATDRTITELPLAIRSIIEMHSFAPEVG
jgi:uncharacterized phiE125 gp8 family phage protein